MAQVPLDEEAFSGICLPSPGDSDSTSSTHASGNIDEAHGSLSLLELELRNNPDSDVSEKYRGLQLAVHAIEDEASPEMAQMLDKVIAFLSEEHEFYSEAWVFCVKALEIEQTIRDQEMDVHLKTLERAKKHLDDWTLEADLEGPTHTLGDLGDDQGVGMSGQGRPRSLTAEDLSDNFEAISAVVASRKMYFESREREMRTRMHSILKKMSEQARARLDPSKIRHSEANEGFLRKVSGYMPSFRSFSQRELSDVSQTASVTTATVAELMAYVAERSCDATAHTSYAICDGAKLALQTGLELVIPPEYWRLQTLCMRAVEGGHFVGKHTINVSHLGGRRVLQLIPILAPPAIALLASAGNSMRTRLSSFGQQAPTGSDSNEDLDRVHHSCSAEQDPGSAESEKDDLELLMCPICFASRWDTALIPCGHLVCATCAERIGERCAQCRQLVSGAQRIFIP